MTDFNKRVKSDNTHLSLLTSARFAHYTGSSVNVVKDAPGALLRVVLNTNGGAVTLKNGSEVIGIIAADAAEGTFDYGVYCNDSIIVELGDTADVTVVFG